DAREMADALRQAGRAGGSAPAPRPVRSVPRAATPARPQPILAKLPARPEPARTEAEPEGREDRKLALLLVTAAMVLMLMLIAAGWFLIGHDGATVPVLPAGTATSTIPRTPS